MAKKKARTAKPRKGTSKRLPSHPRAQRSVPPPVAATPQTVEAEDPTAWRLVNRAQIAELLGIHPDTISDYTRDGMPVTERGGHGRESVYDAVACLNWWRQQQGKGAKEVAQTRSFNAQADLAEQRLRVQRKELFSRTAIVMAWQSMQKGWSVRVQALPRRLIQLGILARENEAIAAGLCKEILTDIASWRGVDDTPAAPEAEADVA